MESTVARGRSLSIWACTLALVCSGVPAAETDTAAHKAGDVVIEPRSLRGAEGESIEYELGTLFVPENRAVPKSRLIGIGFVRIRSTGPAGAVPTFHLPGGPGDSYVEAFTNARANQPPRLAGLKKYRAIGDVVLIDQRGASNRGEMLRYASHPAAQPLSQPATVAADTAAFVAAAKAAVAAHADKDLSGYTVLECSEDVNDLRRALGYERINLVGQSFGSQWSFAVMRLHPEIVARALLSGVEPLDYAYDMPSHVFAALQRIAWDADRDPGLQPYLPKGGLMFAVRDIRDRLAREPINVRVKDEKTGRSQSVVLGLGDFQQALLKPAEIWPSFVLSLYHRHYEEWARDTIRQRAARNDQALPDDADDEGALNGPLIDSSLGVSAAREHLLRTDPASDFLGGWNFDSYIGSAPIWPSPDIGNELRIPVLSRIPVLFVNGDWDIYTPVENTLNMLPYFPNSRTVVVHRGSHGARSLLSIHRPEVLVAILEFLKTGDTQALPAATSFPAPAFQRPAFAPPASPGS
jgi:pimeloyl-ACP methyl ester carboxylesterase